MTPRSHPSPPPSFFVVGTDTGVGKTHVCAALLRGFGVQGLRAVGMKPVAAGAQHDGKTGTWINDDVEHLRAASTVTVPAALTCPVLVPEPLSPHLAAQRAGLSISMARIITAHGELLQQADVVVVEGAGGFLVPLADDPGAELTTGADLALALQLPMLLVVGLRLGCLNHALLTVEAIRTRGLRLLGWIANDIDPHMACVDENVDLLSRRIPAPMLAHIVHGDASPLLPRWPA